MWTRKPVFIDRVRRKSTDRTKTAWQSALKPASLINCVRKNGSLKRGAGRTPTRDENWLVLSIIHSAKGLEWDAVYLIHASDGNLPADLATGSQEEIEEELRLTYVAMTRARDYLYVLWPLRYYSRPSGMSDNHSYAQLSRFFTEEVTRTMECLSSAGQNKIVDTPAPQEVKTNILSRINDMWS